MPAMPYQLGWLAEAGVSRPCPGALPAGRRGQSVAGYRTRRAPAGRAGTPPRAYLRELRPHRRWPCIYQYEASSCCRTTPARAYQLLGDAESPPDGISSLYPLCHRRTARTIRHRRQLRGFWLRSPTTDCLAPRLPLILSPIAEEAYELIARALEQGDNRILDSMGWSATSWATTSGHMRRLCPNARKVAAHLDEVLADRRQSRSAPGLAGGTQDRTRPPVLQETLNQLSIMTFKAHPPPPSAGHALSGCGSPGQVLLLAIRHIPLPEPGPNGAGATPRSAQRTAGLGAAPS